MRIPTMTLDEARRRSGRLWPGISRRQFIVASGAAGGALVTSGLWMPVAYAGDDHDDHHHREHGHREHHQGGGEPRPIPGTSTIAGLGAFHFFFPTPNPFSNDPTISSGLGDPSLITDFRGEIGVAELSGDGIGTDTNTGIQSARHWEADVRFMTGEFVGTDGERHQGTFGFI